MQALFLCATLVGKMPFVPTDRPFSAEVINPEPVDPVLLPDGKLIAREADYWERTLRAAEEADDEGLADAAELMRRGLITLAAGRVALEDYRAAPHLMVARNPEVAIWHDNAVTHLAGSRMLRALHLAGRLQPVEDKDDEILEGLPSIESGLEIFDRGNNVARIAIHAAEDILGRRGLTPLIRNGSTWFRHDRQGVFLETSNPADKATKNFRRTYKRVNGKDFDAKTHFTVTPHLMLRTWSRIYR